MTAVDLEAAVSAGGLAEAISRTANSAQQAGVSMDQLIGYIASVGEVTQRDMTTVGEAFKTIFARYSNVKIGKLTDDESGESLNDFETVLNSIGIALRDSSGNFRNFNEVLIEIGDSYDRLNSVQISALATALGGVRQRENIIVLLENLDKAFGYAETAANSAGTAMNKFAAYEESIEAKAQKMAAAFENLSMSWLSDDLVGGFYDMAAGAFNFAASLPSIVKDGMAIAAVMTTVLGLVKAFKATNFGKSILNLPQTLGWPAMTGDIVPTYSKKAA